MASIYDLKPKFQNFLHPLVIWLAAKGVTANQVTIAAVILSALGGMAILYWPYAKWPLLCIPLVLFIRMALNAIDGMLAREFNQKSRLGAVLNELGDVIADVLLYLPLGVLWFMPGRLLIVVVILGIICEMAGVIGVQIGASRRYDGPMGKSDRAFVFGLLALLFGLGVLPGKWLTIVLWVMIALLVLTIINRARKALGEVQ